MVNFYQLLHQWNELEDKKNVIRKQVDFLLSMRVWSRGIRWWEETINLNNRFSRKNIFENIFINHITKHTGNREEVVYLCLC